MTKKSAAQSLSETQIEQSVRLIRGHKVMLDSDLAMFYGVPTYRLNEAVKRNLKRFPEDFMFQLTKEEAERSRSQFVTLNISDNQNKKPIPPSRSQFAILNTGRGQNIKYLPYAFTEQGVAMLSSVLRSDRAVQVNIAIMRAFVSLRGMMRSQDTIKQELSALKRQYKNHDDQIKTIFLLIDEIIAPPIPKKKRKIGFLRDNE